MMDMFWTHLNSHISNLVGRHRHTFLYYYVINDGHYIEMAKMFGNRK
jgi:hypothetical protein